MRVFVTLDDDLYRVLQNRALTQGLSFQVVISEALARGLAEGGAPGTDGQRRAGNTGRGKGKGASRVDGKRRSFDQLLDEL